VFPVHEPLLAYLDNGLIHHIEGSLNGPIGRYSSIGKMRGTGVLRSHGGRYRAIQDGDVHIDIAIIAAPAADAFGNCSGVGGRAALERFHQGPLHSLGFVAAAALALALPLRRRLGLAPAWLLLAAAGLTHLLLDLAVIDYKPPVGIPVFWPLSAERFHSPVEIFPGIDRVRLLSMRNLRELLVELALCLPVLLLTLRTSRRAADTATR
jgi:hypothetical protein